MDNNDNNNKRIISDKALEQVLKFGKRFSSLIIILVLILVIGTFGFEIATKYIWMDTLNFSDVYTTILYSKVTLGVSGFILFFVLSFLTFYWIRLSYTKQFNDVQLPTVISNGRYAYALITLASIIIGITGSLIVEGLGWEKALKFIHHTTFGVADPFFNMDVSFYIFELPFFQFILYTLLNLLFLFLLIQIGAYSVFNMYRISRHAQIHLATTFGLLGIVLAAIHFLGRYNTLLSDQVNLFQKSVVHGLSYTDKIVNLPKAYVLAVVVLAMTAWIVVSLFRGNIQSSIKPLSIYIVMLVLFQVGSIVVQNFIVSPNEFSKEEPFLQHNLDFTRIAYDLDSIDVKENPGDATLSEDMLERNELTLNNVRLNDSRPLLDIYNQLQTFRTYYQFNDMDIDRYEIDGEYEQVFIGARELSTKDLPEQAQTWVNKNLRYTHGYGIAMSHVNKVTKQGQPEYMLNNIPVEGLLDVERPQIYFGEEDYPNVIVNSKVDEFDYPTGDENATNRYEGKNGIPLQGFNKFLFAVKEASARMFVSDQLTEESQLLQTRNINDRIREIASFFTYDDDPYIFVRDDGSLAWMIDAYVTAEGHPYSEAYKGNNNYIRNSVKVVVDAYTGEVDFYVVDEEDPLVQTYQNMFPTLFTNEIPEDVQEHFRYPVDLFKIQTSMYGTYHMSNLEVFYNREDFWEFLNREIFQSRY